jgi:hypothetical protein
LAPRRAERPTIVQIALRFHSPFVPRILESSRNPRSPQPCPEDPQQNFTATVTETLYGSLRPNDQLDTVTPFLIFRAMEDCMRVVLFLDRRPRQYDFLYSTPPSLLLPFPYPAST